MQRLVALAEHRLVLKATNRRGTRSARTPALWCLRWSNVRMVRKCGFAGAARLSSCVDDVDRCRAGPSLRAGASVVGGQAGAGRRLSRGWSGSRWAAAARSPRRGWCSPPGTASAAADRNTSIKVTRRRRRPRVRRSAVTARSVSVIRARLPRETRGDDWALIKLDRELDLPTLAVTRSAVGDPGTVHRPGLGSDQRERSRASSTGCGTGPCPSCPTRRARRRTARSGWSSSTTSRSAPAHGVDTCQGDSGGPMVRRDAPATGCRSASSAGDSAAPGTATPASTPRSPRSGPPSGGDPKAQLSGRWPRGAPTCNHGMHGLRHRRDATTTRRPSSAPSRSTPPWAGPS